MMKIMLKRRILLFVISLLILSALQYVMVGISLRGLEVGSLVSQEIKTILLITLFVQVAILILLISALPRYLKRLLSGIDAIINEVSQGNYDIEIDLDKYKSHYDTELVESTELFKRMLGIILKFDRMKKEKIQEQRSRILALLSLTENGFIIVNKKGDLVYLNQLVEKHFPAIRMDSNILETNYNYEVDNNIKKYITTIIKDQSKGRPQHFYMNILKRHIQLRSELVKDSNGDFIGTVISIYNLDKKSSEKTKDEDDNESNQN